MPERPYTIWAVETHNISASTISQCKSEKPLVICWQIFEISPKSIKSMPKRPYTLWAVETHNISASTISQYKREKPLVSLLKDFWNFSKVYEVNARTTIHCLSCGNWEHIRFHHKSMQAWNATGQSVGRSFKFLQRLWSQCLNDHTLSELWKLRTYPLPP